MTIGRHIGDVFRQAFIDLVCESGDPTLYLISDSNKLLLPIDFCLWAVFLAADAVMDDHSTTTNWLLMLFATLTSPEYGDVLELDDIRARLSCYLWVSSIHDQRLQRVWSETTELRREKSQQHFWHLVNWKVGTVMQPELHTT